MLIHAFLERAARLAPAAPALIETNRRTSYGELDRLANRFANLYRGAGVVSGDRVVVALDNSAEMVAAYLGALKAGAVGVPLPAGPRSDRLGPAVKDCTPRVAIVDEATARASGADGPLAGVPQVFVAARAGASAVPAPFRTLAEAVAACSDEAMSGGPDEADLAAIIYTSGSTGEPRGVMLTHRNFAANARSIVSYLSLTASDRVMCVLPFYYVYGLSLLHTHLAVGGSLVIENRSAFPNVVLEGMHDHQVTGFAGVPSTFALMMHRSNLDAWSLPTLRYVTQAGGGMPPARISEWLQRGPRADFFVMYGATEASARLTYLPPALLRGKLGSIGRAIPDVDIKVIREDGTEAPQGEVGELVARGPNISSGYWNNPQETALRFGPLGYRTGDLGYQDADGDFYLVGRLHDMIKVGANRVGVKEIEDVLHEHAAVHEAAVVGTAHDMLGEAPVAFVALRDELPDAENTLRAFCAARLAAYKVPLRVIVRRELPKLPGAGKLDRPSLRAAAAKLESDPTAV
jgi:acyl-CoA synthetase (AMP-forming)/AMP-acid ligase II